jgi:hypothetical protein
MQFEWDERKRKEVYEKHGVDILDAARIFNNPAEVEIYQDPRNHGERRFNAIGRAEDTYYCVTYVERGETYRLITAWKLNEKSKAKCQARFARRAERDEEER